MHVTLFSVSINLLCAIWIIELVWLLNVKFENDTWTALKAIAEISIWLFGLPFCFVFMIIDEINRVNDLAINSEFFFVTMHSMNIIGCALYSILKFNNIEHILVVMCMPVLGLVLFGFVSCNFCVYIMASRSTKTMDIIAKEKMDGIYLV